MWKRIMVCVCIFYINYVAAYSDYNGGYEDRAGELEPIVFSYKNLEKYTKHAVQESYNIFEEKSKKYLENKEISNNELRSAYDRNEYSRGKTDKYLENTGCPSQYTGQLPYAPDCRRYWNCRNGKGFIQTCSVGNYFDPETSECHHLASTKCKNSINTLSNEIACPSNVYGLYPHPYNCEKFLQCANGQTYVMNCGPGSAFDSVRLLCDYKQNVKCCPNCAPVVEPITKAPETTTYHTTTELVTLPPETTTTTAQPPETTTTTAPPPSTTHVAKARIAVCPYGAKGLYPHPYDCTKYLLCSNGKTTIQDCAFGTAWSNQLGMCYFKSAVNCNQEFSEYSDTNAAIYSESENRCPSGYEGHYQHPIDVRKYLVCNNGLTIVQDCAPGTSFNMANKACNSKV